MGFQRGRAQPQTLLITVTAMCVLSWGAVNGARRSFSGTERFHLQREAAVIPNSPEIYIRKSVELKFGSSLWTMSARSRVHTVSFGHGSLYFI